MHGALHALPVQAVAATPDSLAALTGANILVFDRRTGTLKAALDARIDARPGAPHGPGAPSAVFPRLCAFSPSGQHLAVASDDKILRVWHIDAIEYGREVMLQRLAKRAGTLQWVSSADGDEVVVADKFGDVWSFVVGATPTQDVADAADEAEASLHPRLGHVSMVTCLAFLPSDNATEPSTIVTCDRDEHIRLSRWGARRAAHVVEQYLLGSRSCVGAVIALPADRAAHAGLPSSERPVLISSDGGACLRVWCSTERKYQLRATVHLDAEKLASYMRVDAATERRRERAASNLALQGAFDPAAPEPDAKRRKRADDAEDGEAAPPNGLSLVIQHLELFAADERDWLLVRIEGAEAVFVVPLDALAQNAANVDMVVCHVGAPVLQTALVCAPGEAPELWTCCDDRPGMGAGPALRKWVWHDGAFSACTVDAPEPLAELVRDAPVTQEGEVPAPEPGTTLVAVARTPRALAPLATLSKLCLYSQVMTWPKPPQANPDGSPFTSLFLHQRTESVARDMVERFQSGKRAAGRAKNQASIQQQFGGDK
ncbi:tRNA (guanine-N(7)-)-methyltransferase non-catalytic subunit trm82 [Malassezia caprae]|uniref:tRNA (Guanine-N(7)-)-methyltransferase non-catalytic subunit trm82 n=1 Tax=Malassezia caprae TaxID=1381934 RepID=A0AAF0E6T2_9BASI|nr:tRNA (guanine-N(7)-)-methyltransferase non-catalytic subunit trm82 [Malassezia caprae]